MATEHQRLSDEDEDEGRQTQAGSVKPQRIRGQGLTCSIVMVALAEGLGIVSLVGGIPASTSLGWTVVKNKANSDSDLPVNCELEGDFGLIQFQKIARNCGDLDVIDNIFYASSTCSEAVNTHFVTADAVCENCSFAGYMAVSLLSSAAFFGLITLALLVYRRRGLIMYYLYISLH